MYAKSVNSCSCLSKNGVIHHTVSECEILDTKERARAQANLGKRANVRLCDVGSCMSGCIRCDVRTGLCIGRLNTGMNIINSKIFEMPILFVWDLLLVS